jgi:transcriptional regulator of acetoin/glycerol metabolism
LARHFAAKYSQETAKRIDHITRAALHLGINRVTLHKKIKRLGPARSHEL